MEIVSRKDAKRYGYKFYYSGIPCKFGNSYRRIVDSKKCQCPECKAKISIKNKKYRENNQDKVRELTLRWSEKNRDYLKSRSAQYRQENQEKVRAYSRVKAGIKDRLLKQAIHHGLI